MVVAGEPALCADLHVAGAAALVDEDGTDWSEVWIVNGEADKAVVGGELGAGLEGIIGGWVAGDGAGFEEGVLYVLPAAEAGVREGMGLGDAGGFQEAGIDAAIVRGSGGLGDPEGASSGRDW
jgi:hypothetical protein